MLRLVFNAASTAVNKYNDVLSTMMELGSGEAFNRDDILQKTLATNKLSESTYKYMLAIGVTSTAEMTFGQKVKLSTMALWDQAKAWAMTPFGMATIAAAAIFAIVKLVDAFTVSLEESREALNALRDEYNDNENELATLNDELQTTIDRINELQGKDSLTFTEAEELDNLRRQNTELERQIALLETIQKQKNKEMNQAFVQTMEKDLGNKKEYATSYKYTSKNYTPQFGTSYVSAHGGAGTTTISEKDLLYSALVRYNELYSEWQNASDKNKEKIKKDLDDVQKYLTDKAAELASDAEGISYITNPTTDDEKAVNEWLDFINDFNDKLMITMGQSGAKENALNRLIFGSFSNATSELKNLGKQGEVTAKHLEDSRYDAFIQKCIDLGIIADDSEGSLEFLASGFNLLSEAVGSTGDGVDNTKKELNGLADSITNLQDAYTLLDKAMEEMEDGGLTVDTIKEMAEQVDNLTDYLYIENGAIKLNTQAWREYAKAKAYSDIVVIQSSIQKLDEENKVLEAKRKEYEDNRALGSDGGMWNNLIAQTNKAIAENNTEIEKNQQLLDIYNILLEDVTSSTNQASEATKRYTNALSDINSLAGGFDQLDSIYTDIYNKGNFDWSSILENEEFVAAFSGLGDAYDDFIKTVANAPDDIDACQAAFDNLATAYLLNSDALKDVTDETRNATVAMLEQMGIANAASIVDAQLAYNKELLRIQTELGEDATYNDIYAMYQECEAASLTEQVLAQLAATKLLTNEDGIKTIADIEQLEGLATSANATTASLLRVAQAKQLMYDAESFKAASDAAQAAGDGRSYWLNLAKANNAYEQAQKLLNQKLEYEEIDFSKYKVEYTGSSAIGSSRKSPGETGGETWFERQYKDHQHWLEMDRECASDYLDWLDDAYKQAYEEGLIDIDEYYRYEEEVLQKTQALFKDHLNDIDHEISILEAGVGNSDEIINLSLQAIQDIEAELAAARAAGLDENGDYIQYLEQQWANYSQTVINLREQAESEAKRAIDDLVEYRIDMLKQEVQDQKDALSEQLDDLQEFYDKQRKMLQGQYDEEKYLEEQSEKRRAVSDIRAELDSLKFDDSAWAQKRKLELEAELAEAEKDLSDFEKDHALDVTLDMLDEQQAAQEAQIQAEIEALDDVLNDPEALFNQALNDIKNNTAELYQEFLEYNRKHGTGNDEDVEEMWEEAYKADQEYKDTHDGESKDGIEIGNHTGYVPPEPETPPQSQTQGPPSETSKTETPKQEDHAKPSLSNGSTVQVKKSATHFSAKSGNAEMASFVPGGTYTVYQTSGSEVLIGRNGEYTGWINKSDIVGYKSGSDDTTAGLHMFDEEGFGSEYIFTSSDGNRYRIFSDGEKVLNARAASFLYDFANTYGSNVFDVFDSLVRRTYQNASKIISHTASASDIRMGDIIINGNTTQQTVSEIRRAQRDGISNLMKEFKKLSK